MCFMVFKSQVYNGFGKEILKHVLSKKMEISPATVQRFPNGKTQDMSKAVLNTIHPMNG